jgi:C-terminal processing protease CtpA/Prc
VLKGAEFSTETERLVAASRLWVTVALFHPYVADKKVDWDSAFVSSIPKIRSARTRDAYAAAIASMLDALHDPTSKFSEAPAQRSLLRTAFETSFEINAGKSVDTLTMDVLPGVQATIRLSEPATEVPVPVVMATFDDPYPSTEARILAAAKTWGTIRYFFAYKDLIDEDWDDVFAQYLPKFIAAKDAREYNLTLCDMLTHLTDSNTIARSKTLDDYFGEAPLGLRLRMLDKHPVVVAVLDPAALEAGVKPGDIIKRVDGESIVDRFNNNVQYVPASTPQRSSYDTLQRILNGPAGSKVALALETPAGEAKSVTLERSHAFESTSQRNGEAVRLLDGNIGYIDLDRASKDETEKAMRQFQSAKALILDLRGKAASAEVIAAHLATQPNTPSAIVTTPLVLHPDVVTEGIAMQTASTFLVETLPAPESPIFKGRTIALIDERTMGEAEQAGLMFEAASKIEFIGTPSAGANSELATFALPGGLTVSYSARDIRHANGGKLQRLGLQPNESAADTAKTIRDGKDVALETALASLTSPNLH